MVDVRQILKLLRQVAELPAATGEREQRVLDGLCALLGASVGVISHVEASTSEEAPSPRLVLDEFHSQSGSTKGVCVDCTGCLFVSHDLDGSTSAAILALHARPEADPLGSREKTLARLFWKQAAFLVPFSPKGVGRRKRDMDSGEFKRIAPLPPRGRQVLEGILDGLSAFEIGTQLDLSIHTVRDHIKVLHKRFGSSSLPELIAVCSGRHTDRSRGRIRGADRRRSTDRGRSQR